MLLLQLFFGLSLSDGDLLERRRENPAVSTDTKNMLSLPKPWSLGLESEHFSVYEAHAEHHSKQFCDTVGFRGLLRLFYRLIRQKAVLYFVASLTRLSFHARKSSKTLNAKTYLQLPANIFVFFYFWIVANTLLMLQLHLFPYYN